MLWFYIPTTIGKRTGLGRTHADRMFDLSLRILLTHSGPKANKLTTVKKCLNEVLKYGGPFNPRDLYPVRGPSLLLPSFAPLLSDLLN